MTRGEIKMKNLEKLNQWSSLLSKTDFKKMEGYKYWKSELKRLKTKEDAKFLLDYLDDFSEDYYYVREEIKELLEAFINE